MVSSWLMVFSTIASCAHTPVEQPATIDRVRALAALPAVAVDGSAFVADRYRNKVVLVTFIASWCFPCLSDLPVLQRMETEFGARGFRNVVVGLDVEGAASLAPMATQFALTFPVLSADDSLRKGDSVYGPIRELPVRIFFGADGHVIGGYSGVMPPEQLRAVIARVVADNVKTVR
jgi:thiol-disulfide isomerase/thioredoxin